MYQIIGLVGLIGSGKDTIGDYFQNKFDFHRDSFAAPLKDMVSVLFNWDRELLEGRTDESRLWRNTPDIWWEDELDWKNHSLSNTFNRFTPRVCLQLFSTNLLRDKFHSNIWISSLKRRVLNYKQNVIVTDCRFPNEIEVIKSFGGTIIRLQRGPVPDWVSFINESAKVCPQWPINCLEYMDSLQVHISEWISFGCQVDITIDNNTTIDDLYKKLEQLPILRELQCVN